MRTHLVTERGEEASCVLVGRSMDEHVVEAVKDFPHVGFLCQPATEDLAARYATAIEGAGIETSGFTLPDGEAAKTFQTVEGVMAGLVEAGFTRDDVIVGVGGGALTDVTGFIAATFLRGVPAVYVPTTLLGAVDASIGGKTAVNVEGKNLAGSFTHPRTVVIDVDTLDALPNTLKREGAAEAIKTGFIADMAIVKAYESSPSDADLEDVVNRSVAVKVAVVSDDFTETDRRAILNYGHTFGHAIESVSGLSHGESVSIGMVAAGAASEHALSFDGAQRQTAVLSAVGLPVRATDEMPLPALRSMTARDKKRGREGLRMVLLEAFESPVVVPVDDATVGAAFAAIGLHS